MRRKPPRRAARRRRRCPQETGSTSPLPLSQARGTRQIEGKALPVGDERAVIFERHDNAVLLRKRLGGLCGGGKYLPHAPPRKAGKFFGVRRQDDAAGLVLQDLHAVFCKGVEPIRIDDEGARVGFHELCNVRIQTFADARPHAEGNAVRGEDVAVERFETAQDAGRELPDGGRVECIFRNEFGIARTRTKARSRRQKDGARYFASAANRQALPNAPLCVLLFRLGK